MGTVNSTKTVTIATGASQSNYIECGNLTLVKLLIPSNFDGSSVTFQHATEAGGTYLNVEDGGSALTVNVTAGTTAILDIPKMTGLEFLKITASTNQADTDTVIGCVLVDALGL